MTATITHEVSRDLVKIAKSKAQSRGWFISPEDAAQEALMATHKAIQKGKVFETKGQLIKYAILALSSRASRLMENRARIDANETPMSAFETEENSFDAPAEVQTDTLSPLRERLVELIATLDPKKRSVMLSYLNGASDVETAKAHDMSAAQVRRMRHYVITRLREKA